MKNNTKYARKILEILIKTFPDAKIELNYKEKDVWQLLVVVLLSAQTTDKKVNEISPKLFENFTDIKDFANAKPKELEPYIRSIGLYQSKAKNLILTAQKIIEDFKGQVPRERARLESLPGVGPKTAAVILANAFHQPMIAVDTHVARVSFRLGLTKQKDPRKIEADLTHLWPSDMLFKAHHTLIFHGRRICKARKPLCHECPLEKLCPKNGLAI